MVSLNKMGHHGNSFISFGGVTESIFTPGLVWSDKTGKVFDVEEPDA